MAHDDRVAAAMRAVPRAGFLPDHQRGAAGYDGPLPIGYDQTCSQPRTVERMLRLLDARAGHRVLDVGAGSGWTTALLAELVGEEGRVLGVELVPELARGAAASVAASGHPQAEVRLADPDVLGHRDGAPYDRILVSANARALPQALVDQLADPGRMVVPVASVMRVVDLRDGRARTSEHGSYRFVPLRQRRGGH